MTPSHFVSSSDHTSLSQRFASCWQHFNSIDTKCMQIVDLFKCRFKIWRPWAKEFRKASIKKTSIKKAERDITLKQSLQMALKNVKGATTTDRTRMVKINEGFCKEFRYSETAIMTKSDVPSQKSRAAECIQQLDNLRRISTQKMPMSALNI